TEEERAVAVQSGNEARRTEPFASDVECEGEGAFGERAPGKRLRGLVELAAGKLDVELELSAGALWSKRARGVERAAEQISLQVGDGEPLLVDAAGQHGVIELNRRAKRQGLRFDPDVAVGPAERFECEAAGRPDLRCTFIQRAEKHLGRGRPLPGDERSKQRRQGGRCHLSIKLEAWPFAAHVDAY